MPDQINGVRYEPAPRLARDPIHRLPAPAPAPALERSGPPLSTWLAPPTRPLSGLRERLSRAEPGGRGWAPDPSGRFELRYWDKSGWTNLVSEQGTLFTDELRRHRSRVRRPLLWFWAGILLGLLLLLVMPGRLPVQVRLQFVRPGVEQVAPAGASGVGQSGVPTPVAGGQKAVVPRVATGKPGAGRSVKVKTKATWQP